VRFALRRWLKTRFEDFQMNILTMMKQPSAFLPVAMSFGYRSRGRDLGLLLPGS